MSDNARFTQLINNTQHNSLIFIFECTRQKVWGQWHSFCVGLVLLISTTRRHHQRLSVFCVFCGDALSCQYCTHLFPSAAVSNSKYYVYICECWHLLLLFSASTTASFTSLHSLVLRKLDWGQGTFSGDFCYSLLLCGIYIYITVQCVLVLSWTVLDR